MRGAAVLVLGGMAAGCGAGARSLGDGLVTNSTGSAAPVMVAQADQPYPGDTQYGRREQPRYGKIVRPQVPVGGSSVSRSAEPLPAPSSVTAPAPVYTAPSTVSSAPLPPPQNSTQGTAPAPVAAAPAPDEPKPAGEPQGQVAVLPQAPKPENRNQNQSGGASAANASSAGVYTVASGDTLYGISRKTGASVESIKQANGLTSGMIRIGQKLTIPSGDVPAGGTMVARTEPVKAEKAAASDPVTTASAAAERPRKETEPRKVSTYTPPSGDGVAKEAEQSAEVAALTPDSTGVGRLRWPARGKVVANFGQGNDGIDIAVPEGTSVRAAENGIVIYAGDGLKGFGNTVLVRHEDGLVTVYGHASQLKVARGDKVKRGQEIALSGMSGNADRPKLHFEVRKGTSPVDPSSYLE